MPDAGDNVTELLDAGGNVTRELEFEVARGRPRVVVGSIGFVFIVAAVRLLFLVALGIM